MHHCFFFKWPKSRFADGVNFHNMRLWVRGVRAADDCGPMLISVNSNISVAMAGFGCRAPSGWRHTVGRSIGKKSLRFESTKTTKLVGLMWTDAAAALFQSQVTATVEMPTQTVRWRSQKWIHSRYTLLLLHYEVCPSLPLLSCSLNGGMSHPFAQWKEWESRLWPSYCVFGIHQ